MSRYIEVDALFAEFENVDWYNNADRDEIAERLVLQAPTIDAVSVVHGEWIDKGRHLWECSNCKMMIYSESEQDRSEFHKWCSRCGAKMKGADDE